MAGRRSVRPPRYEQYLHPARNHILGIVTELVHLDAERAIVKARMFFDDSEHPWEAFGEAAVGEDENPVSQAETRAKKRILLDYLGESAPTQGDYDDDAPSAPRRAPAPATSGPVLCADCGREVKGYGKYSTEQVVAWRIRDHGVPLCGKCEKERRNNPAMADDDLPF